MFKEPRYQESFDWLIPRDLFLINKHTDVFILYDSQTKTADVKGLNQNMIQFLEEIPIEEKTNGLDEALSCLQENVNFI